MASEEFIKFMETQGSFIPPKGDYKETRRIFDERFSSLHPAPTNVEYRGVRIDGVEGEWAMPSNAPKDKAVLYIHGGGFMIGSLLSHRHFVAAIANASGINALWAGYRLAPENPYPAGLEDCISVYRGLIGQGIPANGIVIAGESSGGNLSLATVLYLKDKGEALPAAVVAISATTDFKATSESYRKRADSDPLANEIHEIAKVYAPGEDLENPYISPLYGDYRNFPPLFLQAGTDEVLVGDSISLAEKAKAAGVDVTLRVWEGMGHAFAMDVGCYPEADEGVREIGDYIKACFK